MLKSPWRFFTQSSNKGKSYHSVIQQWIMLQYEKIILRPLNDNDSPELARLANNKKIWDNLRDFIPFPYTIDDAVFFISMVKEEKPVMTFAIEFEGQLCGVIGLVGQKDVYRKQQRSVIGSANRFGTKELQQLL